MTIAPAIDWQTIATTLLGFAFLLLSYLGKEIRSDMRKVAEDLRTIVQLVNTHQVTLHGATGHNGLASDIKSLRADRHSHGNWIHALLARMTRIEDELRITPPNMPKEP